MMSESYVVLHDSILSTTLPATNNQRKLTCIQSLIHINFLLITLSLLIKIGIDGTIYTVCESRYLSNQTGLLDTLDAIGHFLQGLFAYLSFYLSLNIQLRETRLKSVIYYSLAILTCLLFITYPLYNLIKRFAINFWSTDNFRDSSYFLNLWDYEFGLIISLIIYLILIKYRNKPIKNSKFLQRYNISFKLVTFIQSMILSISMLLFAISKHITDNCLCPITLRQPSCFNHT